MKQKNKIKNWVNYCDRDRKGQDENIKLQYSRQYIISVSVSETPKKEEGNKRKNIEQSCS